MGICHWRFFYSWRILKMVLIFLYSRKQRNKIIQCCHDADAIIYEECWSWRQNPGNFSLNNCSSGYVINIQSIEVGFAVTLHDGSCQLVDKCKLTEKRIMTCNNQRSCHFSPYGLDVTECRLNRTRGYLYFLSITYNCEESKRIMYSLYIFMLILYEFMSTLLEFLISTRVSAFCWALQVDLEFFDKTKSCRNRSSKLRFRQIWSNDPLSFFLVDRVYLRALNDSTGWPK